jgi:hypothetical protein
MTHSIKLLQRIIIITAFALCALLGAAHAQEVKQIKLTDAQVKSFISAQSDLAAIASKIQSAGEKPEAWLQGFCRAR